MDLHLAAMNHAEITGADYADIRIQHDKTEHIYMQDLSLKNTSLDLSEGYGIRVLKDGSWGFAHGRIFKIDEVLKTVDRAMETARLSARVKNGKNIVLAHERSYQDTYETFIETDPFSIPLGEKVDLLSEISRIMLNFRNIRSARCCMLSFRSDKIFASTLGSQIKSTVFYVNPSITAVAVNDHDSQPRSFNLGGMAAGYEYIESLKLLERARTVAQEAIMKVNAGTLEEEKRRDLIIDPINLALTIHESVGHPTEADRVLGWEADMAGLSFATPDKLKNFRYGSDIVNLVADNMLEGGLATAGYDDDGVPNQRWYIIKDGILNEYGTTRETAPLIGQSLSRGCNRATSYSDIPINRIPNLYLAPGKTPLSPEELIADTDDGIYIEDQGSWSIDQHRVNFQFGGDLFYEIKNGRKTRMLKKVIYRSNNPEFWNSCDAICDERYFKTFGVINCGKGQPMQSGRMTHGASAARFRNITAGGSK